MWEGKTKRILELGNKRNLNQNLQRALQDMSKTSLKTIYEAVEMRNREAFAIHHQGEGPPNRKRSREETKRDQKANEWTILRRL